MNKIGNIPFKTLLFLDIETVASVSSYDLLPARLQPLWDKKAEKIRGDSTGTAAELFYQKAAIYAEFGKVVCISFGGCYTTEEGELALRVRSFANDDEVALLLDFKALLEKYPAESLVLCAHNGKEFDFPYLCRRMLIHGIPLPRTLQIAGKKPWEILHQDTLELWKFGDYKSFTSLDLLAAVFDIPSSKSYLSGDQVTRVYYQEQDLASIKRYCTEDVVVLAQLYLRLHGMPLIAEHNIQRILD
jgi:DNA polymerase elongation subunit (family B)